MESWGHGANILFKHDNGDINTTVFVNWGGFTFHFVPFVWMFDFGFAREGRIMTATQSIIRILMFRFSHVTTCLHLLRLALLRSRPPHPHTLAGNGQFFGLSCIDNG